MWNLNKPARYNKFRMIAANTTIKLQFMIVLVFVSLLPAIIINIFYYYKMNLSITQRVKTYGTELINQVEQKLDFLFMQTTIIKEQMIATSVTSELFENFEDKSKAEKIDVIRRTDDILRNLKRSVFNVFKYILLEGFALACLFPFVWVIMSSLKDNNEIYGRPFLPPLLWKFENYGNAWLRAYIGTSFFNSIISSFIAVILILLIASMASYIIARIMPNQLLYTYFTIGIMIPIHSVLIPTFIFIKKIGLINTRPGLILVYIAGNLSLAIFILVGFLKKIPHDIEDAAMIDGCSKFRTFFEIILPISKPGLATVATLTFLNCWNEFLFASVLAASPSLKTLTIGVFGLRAQYTTDYGLLCAGLAISIVPVCIMYIVFQEQVIKGLTAGALKG